MRITIETKDKETFKFDNIWELQDNGQKELVLKLHDHSCHRINEDKIKLIHIDLKAKEEK